MKASFNNPAFFTCLYKIKISIVSAILICCFAGYAYSENVYHLYPRGSDVSGDNVMFGFSDWPVLPQPGDVIYLYDSHGPFREMLIIPGTINGAPNNPITFKAAPGNSPVIENLIHFLGGAYIVIEGLTITAPGVSAVGIRQGSHNIIIKDNTIRNSIIGVWISDNGGMQNKIIDNEIYGNDLFGVVADLVNCEAGKETIIAGNRVYDNGSHGIEINANYYIIEGNEVFRNGAEVVETSGIHIYADSAEQDAGNHNIIRYNVSYENIDINGPDGNGIQIDHWCDFNEVYYNLSFNNDGAGISIWDGSNNKVYNNTLFGNARRPYIDMPHFIKADLYIGSDRERNRASHNEIINNIIMADNPAAYALSIDGLTAARPMIVENNLIFHRQRQNHSSLSYNEVADVAELNEASGFENNIYGDPEFQGTELKNIDDFMLKSTSSAIKKGKPVNLSRDLSGNPLPSGTQPDIGAINSLSSQLLPPAGLRVED